MSFQFHSRLLQLSAICLVLFSGTAYSQDKGNCKCRDTNGNLVELGTVICLNYSSNKTLAKCEMSTNTPYWKQIQDGKGCPQA